MPPFAYVGFFKNILKIKVVKYAGWRSPPEDYLTQNGENEGFTCNRGRWAQKRLRACYYITNFTKVNVPISFASLTDLQVRLPKCLP